MNGRYQIYPEYKDSGIGWIGTVPVGWEVQPCRSVVRNIAEKNEGAANQNYLSLMANIGVIKYEDKGDVGNKKPDDLSKCKIVRKGQLVINSMNYAIGSYGMSDYDGVCSPVYIVLETNDEKIERRFALRVFENTPFQKYLATFGNGILEHRAAISWDDIKGAYIPVPSKSEQLTILNFLDQETAKIDTLIEKQQQLIKLLKEKRQAVISHAVTKGLNPDAPMRDSGVEWLGEVPAHWVVGKVAYCSVSLDQYRVPIEASVRGERQGEYPYYGASGVIDHVDDYLFDEPLVLVCEDGWNLMLRSQPVARPAAGKIWVNNHAHVLRSSIVDPSLLAACIEQTPLHLYVTGMRQPKLTADELRNIPVAYPPDRDEQRKLVSYIDEVEGTFSLLESRSQDSIELLAERRTALISAAVTGKIDVRSWVAPQQQQNENNKEEAA